MNKFTPCRKCVNKPGPQPGYFYEEKDGFLVTRECSCHKTWRRSAEVEATCKNANIQPDFTFEDYKGSKSLKSLEALKKISSNYQKFNYRTMFYMWGNNGCQKTSMAQALGKKLIENRYSVQYCTMDSLISALVKDFNESNTEQRDRFIKRCTEVDLLILDESFDKEKVTIFKTGYQIPYLDNFLRNRFEINKKSILFISNKLPTDIEKNGFGKSIQNFVERNTQHTFLKFEDVYFERVGMPDCEGIFN